MRSLFLVALLLLSTSGASASSAVSVESEHAAFFSGRLAVDYPGGIGFVEAWGPAEVVLANVTGSAVLYTWREARANGVATGLEPADPLEIALVDATIVVRAGGDEGYSAYIVAGEGARVGIAGDAPARAGRAGWLDPGYARFPTPGLSPLDPPALELTAPRGWGALGELASATYEPRPTSPILRASGGVEAELDGEEVTILHGNGTSEVFTLAAVDEAPLGMGVVQRQRNLFVVGQVGSLEAPAKGYWLASGPRPEWRVEGAVDWPRAAVTQDGVRSPDEPVHVEGSFALQPDPSRSGDLEADRFDLSGDYALRGSGVLLTEARLPAGVPLPVWTLWAAVTAFVAFFASPHVVGRFVAPFYTRIASADIATHPARALICQALTQAPGVHVRDLHRRVGGAWGTFSFHLGMLRQAGTIRFEREGRYVAVYLSHQAVGLPAPRTATAQRILDALPHDGAPLVVTRLRDATGLSRQLLDHHLAALAQQGLVHVDEGRPRRVCRQVAR